MKKATFTPEQVLQLEKKLKCELIHISVFLDDKEDLDPKKRDKVECIIKDPLGLDSLTIMAAILEQGNNLERGQYMLDNLWVDGDERFTLSAETTKAINARVRYAGSLQALRAIPLLDAAVVKH